MSSTPATLGTVQGIAALLYATCQAGLVGYSAHRWQMLGRDRQPPATCRTGRTPLDSPA
ncbi:MAG TPA: hypothetical protein VI504_16640 [Candidatus Eisenbacteria bacterium]